MNELFVRIFFIFYYCIEAIIRRLNLTTGKEGSKLNVYIDLNLLAGTK